MAGWRYFWGAKVTKNARSFKVACRTGPTHMERMPCCRGCRSLNYLFGGDNCLKASKGKASAQWPRHPVHPAATGNERIPAGDIVTVLLNGTGFY